MRNLNCCYLYRNSRIFFTNLEFSFLFRTRLNQLPCQVLRRGRKSYFEHNLIKKLGLYSRKIPTFPLSPSSFHLWSKLETNTLFVFRVILPQQNWDLSVKLYNYIKNLVSVVKAPWNSEYLSILGSILIHKEYNILRLVPLLLILTLQITGYSLIFNLSCVVILNMNEWTWMN